MPHGEGNIRAGPNSDVVKHTDKCIIGGPCLPVQDLRWEGDGFVRVVENEASNHRGIIGMSIREIELVHNLVDEHGLGQRNCACRVVG